MTRVILARRPFMMTGRNTPRQSGPSVVLGGRVFTAPGRPEMGFGIGAQYPRLAGGPRDPQRGSMSHQGGRIDRRLHSAARVPTSACAAIDGLLPRDPAMTRKIDTSRPAPLNRPSDARTPGLHRFDTRRATSRSSMRAPILESRGFYRYRSARLGLFGSVIPIRLTHTPTTCSVSCHTVGKGSRCRNGDSIWQISDCAEVRTWV